jgi:hypothetical protein
MEGMLQVDLPVGNVCNNALPLEKHQIRTGGWWFATCEVQGSKGTFS